MKLKISKYLSLMKEDKINFKLEKRKKAQH